MIIDERSYNRNNGIAPGTVTDDSNCSKAKISECVCNERKHRETQWKQRENFCRNSSCCANIWLFFV